jgi:hypothetical protein
MRREQWTKWTVSMAAMLALCCQGNISPQPEPPVRSIFDIDVGQVEAKVDSFSNNPAGLRGGPGSAAPPGATLRVVNLEDTTDPRETLINDDGSFEVLFSVAIGDEVRLQIFADGQRSDPFDVRVEDDEAPPVRADRPLTCLKLPLELDLASGSGILRVENTCTASVELSAPTLRRPVAGLVAGEGLSWPATLQPGERLDIVVEADGSATFPLEEVVFVRATSPSVDRRPITIRAEF